MKQITLITVSILFVTPISYANQKLEKDGDAYFPQRNKHIYIGARAGWATFDGACTSNASECNDDTLGYGVYGGYQFRPWFALEGGITDYGSPDAAYGSDGDISSDIYGVQASGLFMYRMTDNWTPYLRLGGTYQNIKNHSDWEGKEKGHDWKLLMAGGVDYVLSTRWSIRAEYQFTNGIGSPNTGEADLHYTSIGLTYHFNQKEPVTYVTKDISLDSNALFDFDSAIIKSTSELQDVGAQLQQYKTGSVRIVGYTDSVGTKAYNQKLSEQRAKAVYDYLKSSGVVFSHETILGAGEGNPVADNSTAEGRAKNRRVEIQFITTKQEELK